MCERTCPFCGSTEHFVGVGILGSYIDCEDCGATLAARADPEAASTDLTWDEAERWADENTFVIPGAEAKDPLDDRIWTPRARA
jgi:hypothetical protein